MRTKPWDVPDGLWERLEPHLPKRERRFRYPGRMPLGFGRGMTCWRRLRAWQQAGVWQRLYELLLAELHAAGESEWSRAIADSGQLDSNRRSSISPD
jgi:transposase